MVLKIIGIVLLCVLGIIALLLVLPFSVMLKKTAKILKYRPDFCLLKKSDRSAEKRSGPKDEKTPPQKRKKGKETAAKSRKKNSKLRFRRET